MDKRFGLSEETLNRLHGVFPHSPQLEKVILYGSRAKGTFRKGADIDITLKGKDLDLKFLSRISLEIDDLMLPYFYDISLFDNIDNRELVEHIQKVGKEIYSRIPDSHSGNGYEFTLSHLYSSSR